MKLEEFREVINMDDVPLHILLIKKIYCAVRFSPILVFGLFLPFFNIDWGSSLLLLIKIAF